MSRIINSRVPCPELGGDPVRVVVLDDVIALPDLGWSGAGYGEWISPDWLRRSPRIPLPGSTTRRCVLSRVIPAVLSGLTSPLAAAADGCGLDACEACHGDYDRHPVST
jgi:hypothetical protein